MAGMAIVLDVFRKKSQSLHSSGFLSPSFAASTAALATPFTSYAFFGRGLPSIAHCDFGATTEDYIPSIHSATGVTIGRDSFVYPPTKEYNIELKPLFLAFQWKTFAATSLRAFLLFYGPRPNMEDFEEGHVDLVVPFKKSVKQIARETTVATTRRVLERLSVHYVSQRLAWKLLKDVPKSAERKAQRQMPTHIYIFSVSRTTLRGHCLGVLASWVVQVGIDVYSFFHRLFNSKEETNEADNEKQLQLLGQKIYIATIRCGSSLVFASIGAGIGAKLIRPSTGQWIGCTAGDLMGALFVTNCFEKVYLAET